jgi:hypothetical protein
LCHDTPYNRRLHPKTKAIEFAVLSVYLNDTIQLPLTFFCQKLYSQTLKDEPEESFTFPAHLNASGMVSGKKPGRDRAAGGVEILPQFFWKAAEYYFAS